METITETKPTLPKGLKYCYDNPFKTNMGLKIYESILIDIFGIDNLSKRAYTEKYTNVKLVLFYYKNQHIGTYNKSRRESMSFYE